MTRRSIHVGRWTAYIALSVCVVAPIPAWGDDSETGGLRQEVTELKQIIQHLNERVEGLEKQLVTQPEPGSQAAAAPAAQPSASTPEATTREHWRQIDYGMTVQNVEALIGRPQRTMTVNLKTVWYYTYPEVGSGSIVFAQDGGVDDWQTPPFNTWW